jgi:hypothetical protein
MPHGGKRRGAGRKPGSLTKKTIAIAEAATAAGITPLDFMLAIVRDETADRRERAAMAVAAAPYVHPRLAATVAKVEVEELMPTVVIRHFVPYDDPRVGTTKDVTPPVPLIEGDWKRRDS